MKKFSKNNIKCPFFVLFPKYEQKLIFCKNLFSYYKLGNILYFASVTKFLTFMKGLERFFIIDWVVGEELVRKIKRKNKLISYLIPGSLGENWCGWSKGYRISEKKREFKIFKLIKVKRHHLGPIIIYCGEKTQFRNLFFYYYYYHFNLKKALNQHI